MAEGWLVRVRQLAVVGLMFLVSVTLLAQKPSAVAFEVATIRPTPPGSRVAARVLPARVELVGHDLRDLIMLAFGKQVYELSVPAWLTQPRYDIQATYPAGATQSQFPEMLQALLVSRFGLVAHIEPRRVDAYDLVVGKDGIKMAEVEAVNEVEKDFTKSGPRTSSDMLLETATGPTRTMALPDEIGMRTVTTRSFYESRTTIRRTTQIDATRISIPEFASLLRLNLDKPVIDRTGLKGLYRFKVELDTSRMALRMVTRDVNGNPINREPTGVDTLKAVEGLGLKLEERRDPMDVLVVDKIERTPTEN
jgi:uncharacterized protein (TIGR03435 family)